MLNGAIRLNAWDAFRPAEPAYAPPEASAPILRDVWPLVARADAAWMGDFPGIRFLRRIATGDLYYQGELALDTDGSTFQSLDATGQPTTAWQPGGKPIDSNAVPYFSVLTRVLRDPYFGIRNGDYAAIIYRDRIAFAVLADNGGKTLGEGSIELIRQLGFERVAKGKLVNAGIGAGVITIAFPGSADRERPTRESVRTRGGALWDRFRAQAVFMGGRSP